MPNRLANETSPYLLQHKDNPVDWYPWGEEAFAEARRLDKPVLLSVGYSACHWCHVMEHESFEDRRIAGLMNERFVNVKVDREERPDVDAIYMQAVQALTGRGGWPMTVFLTPDAVPFYAGTYFPPDDRGGMPAFPRVLSAVADAYKTKREDVEQSGRKLLDHLASSTRLAPGDAAIEPSALDAAAGAMLTTHDRDFGGFGKAPKFPQPMALDFLLRYHHRTRRPEALEAAESTLRAMAHGGIYDQVGGGFHRYSTDAIWLVPHFEKMLYDNALLARVYLDAYKLTGDAFYRRIVEETLDYVLREMTDPRGGFYSTQDADSEGEEGKFFLWTRAELQKVLGPDAALVGDYFSVTEAGNFEGRNILHVAKSADRFAAEHDLDPAAFEKQLARARKKLYTIREKRVHPARDEKVLTAWNGLMLRAFAEAALALDSQPYRDAAVRNADFLLDAMRPEGRLLRTWKPVLSRVEGPVLSPVEGAGAGRAHLKGYLEDYSMLADGLLALYQATFEPRYLREAVKLTDEMLELFWDDSVQGFFDTGRDHETLITRPRDFFDNATPSGTSVAADLLLHLAILTDNADYERRAVTCLRTLAPFVDQAATGFGRLLSALDYHLSRSQELALVWPKPARSKRTSAVPPDPGRSARPESARPEPGRTVEGQAFLNVIRRLYLPNLLLAGAPVGEDDDLSPLFRDRPAVDAKPTAYLCERYACQSPTTDPKELRHQLEAVES